VGQQIVVFLLQGIPEGMASAFFGLSVFNIRFKKNDIVVIGLLHALMAILVRSLPFTFGVHGVILAAWLTLVIFFRVHCPIMKALGATLLSGGMLAVLETIMFFIVVNGLDVPYDDVLADPLLRTLLGLSCPSILAILAGVIVSMRSHFKQKRGRGLNA